MCSFTHVFWSWISHQIFLAITLFICKNHGCGLHHWLWLLPTTLKSPEVFSKLPDSSSYFISTEQTYQSKSPGIRVWFFFKHFLVILIGSWVGEPKDNAWSLGPLLDWLLISMYFKFHCPTLCSQDLAPMCRRTKLTFSCTNSSKLSLCVLHCVPSKLFVKNLTSTECICKIRLFKEAIKLQWWWLVV